MTDADIAVFILARIAEREADADEIHDRDCTLITMGVSHGWCDCPQPERVKARCAVDRQILALHRLYDDQPYRETPCCERCTAGGEYPADDAYTDEQNWPCPTLRALASLDADHPDYNEDWKP